MKKNQTLLNQAKSILLASNSAVIDGYDVSQNFDINGIAFSLPELIYAFERFKALKMLDQAQIARTEQMLKKCADYWLVVGATPSTANLLLRYGQGTAMVANLFPTDRRAAQWRKFGETTFNNTASFPASFEKAPKLSIQKFRNLWGFIPDAVQPDFRPAPGVGENSSHYVPMSMMAWIGLGEALGRQADLKRPEVRAWVDTYYQQITPSGILPNYGDANWGATAEWIGVLEWMGNTFKAPQYRWAADAALKYMIAQKAFAGDLSIVIPRVNETIPVTYAARQSRLLKRQSTYGQPVPDKIILRGAQKPEEAPFVMVQAMNGGTSHTHAFGGAIGSYALGQSVILHDGGYAATSTFFHNMFMIRPSNVVFPGFYGDPNGTIVDKIADAAAGLRTDSPNRITTDAQTYDFRKFAYGRVSFDCVTFSEADKSFNYRGYTQTRETVLDKETGVLAVFDTLTALSNGEVQAGPVWHAQSILAQNASGFLVQNDKVLKVGDVTYTTPPRPVWVAMAASAPVEIRNQHWYYYALRYGKADNPQTEHFYARYAANMKAGETVSFLTIFAPQPTGTVTIPSDVQLNVTSDMATARIGKWTYTFRAGAKGTTPRFEARSDQNTNNVSVRANGSVSGGLIPAPFL